MARVCGWHGILPNSACVSNYQRESVYSGGGNSTVWIGRHNGQKVIIKVLDFYLSFDDAKKKELIKVGYRFTKPAVAPTYALASYRSFARRW